MAAPGTFPRTLKRAPNHAHMMGQLTPYRLVRRLHPGAVPASNFWLVALLSYFLNATDGDCVTAARCCNIALRWAGYLVPDSSVLVFISKWGIANGADPIQVNQILQTTGLPDGTNLWKEGPASAVNVLDLGELASAISELSPGGCLSMNIRADELERAANDSIPFNFAFNFSGAGQVDHEVGPCGYGTAQQCLDALNACYQAAASSGRYSPVALPSGIDPGRACMVFFSWKRFWIADIDTTVKNISDGAIISTPTSIRETNNVPPPPPPAPRPTHRASQMAIAASAKGVPSDDCMQAINAMAKLPLTESQYHAILDIIDHG